METSTTANLLQITLEKITPVLLPTAFKPLSPWFFHSSLSPFSPCRRVEWSVRHP